MRRSPGRRFLLLSLLLLRPRSVIATLTLTPSATLTACGLKQKVALSVVSSLFFSLNLHSKFEFSSSSSPPNYWSLLFGPSRTTTTTITKVSFFLFFFLASTLWISVASGGGGCGEARSHNDDDNNLSLWRQYELQGGK